MLLFNPQQHTTQAQPRLVADAPTLQQLTARIQDAGTEVVKAKVRGAAMLGSSHVMAIMQAGAGSATLSMAYAAYRFGEMCLAAMEGRPVKLCAYVESALLPDVPYFASPLVLGPNGIAGGLLVCAWMCRCGGCVFT